MEKKTGRRRRIGRPIMPIILIFNDKVFSKFISQGAEKDNCQML